MWTGNVTYVGGRDTLQGDSTSLRSVPAPPIVSFVPAVAGTCIQRAPPPTLVRGCTSPLEGIPSSVQVDAVVEGLDKVNVEFGLVALAHNLRKYARVQTFEHPITSEPVVAELPKTHEKVAA